MERERGQPVWVRSQREERGLGSRDRVYPSRPSRGAARAGPGRGTWSEQGCVRVCPSRWLGAGPEPGRGHDREPGGREAGW